MDDDNSKMQDTPQASTSTGKMDMRKPQQSKSSKLPMMIGIIVVLIIAGVGIFFFFGSKNNYLGGQSSSNIANSSWSSYSNPKLKISFSHPSTWQIANYSNSSSSGGIILVYAPTSGSSGSATAGITILALPANNATARSGSYTLYNYSMRSIKSSSTSTLASQNNITVSGHVAPSYVVQSNSGTQAMYVFVNATADGGSYFIINYIGLTSSVYSSYLPVAQQIISSVKFG